MIKKFLIKSYLFEIKTLFFLTWAKSSKISRILNTRAIFALFKLRSKRKEMRKKGIKFIFIVLFIFIYMIFLFLIKITLFKMLFTCCIINILLLNTKTISSSFGYYVFISFILFKLAFKWNFIFYKYKSYSIVINRQSFILKINFSGVTYLNNPIDLKSSLSFCKKNEW